MCKPLTTTALFNDWLSRRAELPPTQREAADLRLINSLIHEAGNGKGVVYEMDRVVKAEKERAA